MLNLVSFCAAAAADVSFCACFVAAVRAWLVDATRVTVVCVRAALSMTMCTESQSNCFPGRSAVPSGYSDA